MFSLLYHTFTGHALFLMSFCCLLQVEFACKCDLREKNDGEKVEEIENEKLCKFTNKCLCESYGLPLTPISTMHVSCVLI